MLGSFQNRNLNSKFNESLLVLDVVFFHKNGLIKNTFPFRFEINNQKGIRILLIGIHPETNFYTSKLGR